MTIDTRAYVWCNLGPLSEEGVSIAEDHAQGAGVLMLKGTINLNGIFRPNSGDLVKLSYSDGQTWIAQLPLRLRVLSCFSDPIRNRTTVSVGCDLAFYENRKEPVTLDTRDENSDVPEAQWRAQTPPLSAAWLVSMILCILRIEYIGTIPLTNYFTVQDFDMSSGYVEELGKLCASEGYVCRMNENGKAEFIDKNQPISAGPVLTEADLIDLNPINVGELPGDAVYAKYNSLKLKAPEDDDEENEDERKKRNWEKEESFGSIERYRHNWTEYLYTAGSETRQRRDSYGHKLYNSSGEILDPVYEVKGFEREEEIRFAPYSTTTTAYDSKDRAMKRVTVSNGVWGITRTETYFTYAGSTSVNPATEGNIDNNVGGYPWAKITCSYDNPNSLLSLQVKKRKNQTPKDVVGELTEERTLEWSPIGPIRQQLGVQDSFESVKQNGRQYQSLYRETKYEKDEASGITKTITRSLIPYIQTFDGSESLSRLRDKNQPWENNNDNYLTLATGLRDGGTEVKIRTEREFGIQRRPSQAERTTSQNKKTPDVEDEARIAWAVGSAASQTAIELSPPYAPDDRVVGSNGSYAVIPSGAAQKALAYARTENRYLFGHRNGAGIQVLPEALPPKPLSVFYIRLKGCTAAFLVNGRTWNLDPNGATVTCDALFWGAIDGTLANAWFPLPPDIGWLPAPATIPSNSNPVPANAIPIPIGFDFSNPDLNTLFGSLPTNQAPIPPATIAPEIIIKPYHETTAIAAGSGSGAFVSVQFWAPQPPVAVLAGSGSGAFAVKTLLSRPRFWISAASTFTPTPGTRSISTAMNASFFDGTTTYSIGEVEVGPFNVGANEIEGGTFKLETSGNVYTVEFVLPASQATNPLVAFDYLATSLVNGKVFVSAVQSYTGTVSSITIDNVDLFGLGTENLGLILDFEAIGGPVTSIKHTLTIAFT